MLAQQFEQRGFIENGTVVYPQTTPNDSGRVVDELLFREEASYKFAPWLTVGGAFDARTDSHRQTARDWNVANFDDQSILRPAFSVRRLSATIHRGKVTAEIGRQLIRWGKTDILNPTDRFAPKDYLSSVVDPEVLGVTAARVTYESGGNTIDLSLAAILHAQPYAVVKPALDGAAGADRRREHRRRGGALSGRVTVWGSVESLLRSGCRVLVVLFRRLPEFAVFRYGF